MIDLDLKDGDKNRCVFLWPLLSPALCHISSPKPVEIICSTKTGFTVVSEVLLVGSKSLRGEVRSQTLDITLCVCLGVIWGGTGHPFCSAGDEV